jgi:hypothetical protein
VTTIQSPTRQGFHDRSAHTIVVRSVRKGACRASHLRLPVDRRTAPYTLGRGRSASVVHSVLHILSPTPAGSWISRRPRLRISWTTALRPPPCRRIFRLARRGPQGQREPRSHQGSGVGDHINDPDDEHITDGGGDHINAGDGEGSDVHRGPGRSERRKVGAAQRRRGVPRSHQGAERSRGWFLRALPCPPSGGPPGGT